MTKELLQELGRLAKRRREEIGLGKPALIREMGVGSENAITAFELGRALPPAEIRRELERALNWRLEVIDEVLTRTNHSPGTLIMEELDAEDSYRFEAQFKVPSLISASDDELRAEMARRGI